MNPADDLPQADHKARLVLILAGAAAALWSLQVWRPSSSYPFQGVSSLGVLALLILLAWWLAYSREEGRSPAGLDAPAAWAGTGFLLYAWARWAAEGFAAVGDENVITLLLAGLWAAAGYGLGSAARRWSTPDAAGGEKSASVSLLTIFYATIAAVALFCGIHAVAQYAVLYDRHLEDLLRSLGTTPPTTIQEGLIHHLKLKRVASVWGDPNALAGFSALSLAPSAWCAHTWKRRRSAGAAALSVLGLCAFPAALVAIALSGSRGGVLDALLLACLALLFWRAGRPARPANRAVAAAAAALFWVLIFPGGPVSGQPPAGPQDPSSADSAPLPAFLSRIDTIRERVYYAQVGTSIFLRNPVFGSGPGAVDLYYGRYRPVEARESKYLHNWVLQIAVEYGLIGLGLAGVYLFLLFRPARWRLAVQDPLLRPLLLIGVVFVLDALVQLSFNQRELMGLFGLTAGLLLSTGTRREQPGRGRRPAGAVFVVLLIAAVGVHAVPSLISAGYRQAAGAHLENDDKTAAIRALRRAISWAPRDPEPLLTLGIVQARSGNLQAGTHYMKKALALEPRSANLHAQLARVRMKAGRLDEAAELARQALELYPHNADHHLMMSEIEQARGNLPAALESARRAVITGYRQPEFYRKRLQELQQHR